MSESRDNIQLTPELAELLNGLMQRGEYATAQDAVRAGLTRLHEEQYQSLIQEWMVGGLTPEIESALPPDVVASVKARLQEMIGEARESVREDGTLGPSEVEARVRARLAEVSRQRAENGRRSA